MKIWLVIVVGLANSFCGVRLDAADRTKFPSHVRAAYSAVRHAGGLGDEERFERLAAMTSEEKNELLWWIKSSATAAQPNDRIDDALMMYLGDEETMRKQVAAIFHDEDREAPDALNLLATVRDPKVIEMLAPVMFIEDNFQESGWLPYHRSVEAETRILKIIKKTPGFSEELYNWVPKVEWAWESHRQPIMRRWWKENDKHFKERNYLLVKPGEVPPDRNLYEPIQGPDGIWSLRLRPSPSAPAALALPPDVPAAFPASTPAPAATTPPVAESISAKKPWFPYAALAAFLLLIAAWWIVSLRRRN